MKPIIIRLAWAWQILVGALLITPGGVLCIACGQIQQAPGYVGRPATLVIGVVSILLGVYGLATSGALGKAAAGAAAGK
jgi:hypothetical protein